MAAGRADARVVVVSGAAAGIGAATARRFAAEGWVVYGIDLAPAAGLAQPGDVAVEATWVTAAAAQSERFGGLDALVNNAGTNVRGTIEEADLATWQRL